MTNGMLARNPLTWIKLLNRLHRSTYGVAACVAFVGIIVNCGGELHDENEPLGRNPVNYGCPWTFANWRIKFEVAGKPFDWTDWWRMDRCDTWHWGTLAANLVVWLVLVLIAGGLWERRRRRRARLFQFTIGDLLMLMSVVAVVTTFFVRLYDDNRAEERFDQQLKQVPEVTYDCSGKETPANWFWETLHVPLKYQPQRRNHLILRPAAKDYERKWTVPDSLIREVGQARYLRNLFLHNLSFSPEGCRFADWPQMEGLSINSTEFGDEHLRALPFLPRLAYLSFERSCITDTAIPEIRRHFPALQGLRLYMPMKSQGHTLETLNGVLKLYLINFKVDDETISQIGKLTQLTSLDLDDQNESSQLNRPDWMALKNLVNLQEFRVNFNTDKNANFDDHALDALAQLPQLKTLTIQDHARLTDAGLAVLQQFPALMELGIHLKNDGKITDAGIDHLVEFARGRKMKTLDIQISGCSKPAYQRLKAVCPELRSFYLEFEDEE